MSLFSHGYLHLYIGTGRGKSSIAFATAMRVLSAGGSVLAVQFLKSVESGEVLLLSSHPSFTHLSCWDNSFILSKPTDKQCQMAASLAVRAAEKLANGAYDLLIVDEGLDALGLGVIAEDALRGLIAQAGQECEVIVTGREAPEWLLAEADLVSVLHKERHYYDKGVAARKGIEY